MRTVVFLCLQAFLIAAIVSRWMRAEVESYSPSGRVTVVRLDTGRLIVATGPYPRWRPGDNFRPWLDGWGPTVAADRAFLDYLGVTTCALGVGWGRVDYLDWAPFIPEHSGPVGPVTYVVLPWWVLVGFSFFLLHLWDRHRCRRLRSLRGFEVVPGEAQDRLG